MYPGRGLDVRRLRPGGVQQRAARPPTAITNRCRAAWRPASATPSASRGGTAGRSVGGRPGGRCGAGHRSGSSRRPGRGRRRCTTRTVAEQSVLGVGEHLGGRAIPYPASATRRWCSAAPQLTSRSRRSGPCRGAAGRGRRTARRRPSRSATATAACCAPTGPGTPVPRPARAARPGPTRRRRRRGRESVCPCVEPVPRPPRRAGPNDPPLRPSRRLPPPTPPSGGCAVRRTAGAVGRQIRHTARTSGNAGTGRRDTGSTHPDHPRERAPSRSLSRAPLRPGAAGGAPP